MSALPSNVDIFHYTRGRPVIYDARGYAFRAKREGRTWKAWPSHSLASRDPRFFWADTLHALAAKVGGNKAFSGN